jgi:hypothetical protein
MRCVVMLKVAAYKGNTGAQGSEYSGYVITTPSNERVLNEECQVNVNFPLAF